MNGRTAKALRRAARQAARPEAPAVAYYRDRLAFGGRVRVDPRTERGAHHHFKRMHVLHNYPLDRRPKRDR